MKGELFSSRYLLQYPPEKRKNKKAEDGASPKRERKEVVEADGG